ncbi:hypothetical protein [Tropicimonas sediminicola]|uniref:Lipoprotein n=1 Tax=Tropicimonas sediminicola TaxID=1031541 RepID=A0A239EH76_9RHOB|nr:hypothetical protein [Tropicimonas sediminicola]SNS44005.1 hypothetical protein SAMN05421757_102153 [Tropicimonas sediminicola]
MKPRHSLLLTLPALAACGPAPDVPVAVTSRAPNATFACIAPRLERLPLRYDTRPTPDGWRMDLLVFAGPPAGWYRNGTIEHSDGTVLYAPDGATLGIFPERLSEEIAPILRRCTGR